MQRQSIQPTLDALSQASRSRFLPAILSSLLLGGVLGPAIAGAATDPSPIFYRHPGGDIALQREPTMISLGLREGVAFEKATLQLGEGEGEVHMVTRPTAQGARLATLQHVEALPGKDRETKEAELERARRLQEDSLAELRRDPATEWAYPAYRSVTTGTLLLPTPYLLVGLRPGSDATQLERLGDLLVSEQLPLVSDQFRLRLLRLDDDPIAVANELTDRHPWIEWAEPDFIQQIDYAALPNDPLISQSWHVSNTGQGSPAGVPGADARLAQAWDTEVGDPGIVIAVIDDGVQLNHPDLVARIFVNPGEIPGNGGDDDGNGFVDDIRGWDFFENDANANPALDGPGSHGTAVAGVAAATGNNGIGGSGACQRCRILPVRVSAPNGFANNSVLANALNYAASFADVLNNSWGGGAPSAAIDAAVANAVGNGRGGKGAPVLFATHNYGTGFKQEEIDFGATGSGLYTFRWEFAKDAVDSAGFDTAWLDNVILPDGTLFDFEAGGCSAAGWSTGGHLPWTVIGDETRSSSARGGRCALKAGSIGHNQTSWVEISRTMNPAAGSKLRYHVWASAEAKEGDGTGPASRECWDGVAVWVRLPNNSVVGPLNVLCGTYSNQGRPLVDGTLTYPASNPQTIAVGAISNFERRSDYSVWGPGIDFVAHSGGGSLGIIATDVTGANGYSTGDYDFNFGGTSSATPLAAGITGLLLSHQPQLTAAQVRTRLRQATRKVGSVPYVADFNTQYGYGALDAQLLLVGSAEIFADGFETGSTARWNQ